MIKRIKDFFSRYTKPEMLMLLLVIAQITYLMLFNVLRTKYVINSDSSEYMTQVIQIWKQGTLLIKDYYYSTMLTWDMPTLIAVPFYGIFKDVFLAYGMANNVLILLFAGVLNKLCNDLEYSKGAKWLVFLATFTVYHYGFIDYADELFVNGALYGFRIMFMLVLMDVLVCIHKNKFRKRDVLIYVFSFVGFFVCGISSGIFAAGCCVLPIILFAFWELLCQKEKIKVKDFFQKKFLLPVLSLVACMMGVVANYLLGFDGSSASNKMTISILDMGNNFENVLISYFQLFGWSDANVNLISLVGIMQIVGFGAACVVLVAFIIVSWYCLKKDTKDIKKTQRIYGQMVFCIFLVNFLLFFLADLTYGAALFEYRYWLIVVIPAFVEIGVVYDWLKKKSYNHWVMLVLIYVLMLCSISGYKDIKMWREDNGADYYDELMDIAQEKGIDHIYCYADYFYSRITSAFAKENMDVFAISHASAEDGGMEWIYDQLRMPKFGTYVKYNRDCMLVEDDRKLGILIADYIGEEYRFLESRAKEVIEVEGSSFKLLVMDENYIDFVYGLPEVGASHSRDYFNWGYEKAELILNENGVYQSTGTAAELLKTSFSRTQAGNYTATLQYEVLSANESIPAYLEISVTDETGNTTTFRENIKAGQTEISIVNFSIQEGDVYHISVVSKEGTILCLKQMDYYRE